MHGEAAQFRRRHNIKARRQISRSRQREIARIRTTEDFIEVRVGLKRSPMGKTPYSGRKDSLLIE
jgi:hypothetical protein